MYKRQALAQVENGRLFITVSDPGSHKIEIHFSVPMPESAASQSLTIPIARTPLTEWILDIPEKNLDITVNRALNREVSNTETVSYTHLDVYKRQILRRGPP